MLEQILYEPTRVSRKQGQRKQLQRLQILLHGEHEEHGEKSKQFYRVIDLENLSTIVLYTAPIKSHSWGKSFNADLYIKKTSLGDLHVHCTNNGLVTGAKLNGKPITNYEAAMIDLLPGKALYKKGFGKW